MDLKVIIKKPDGNGRQTPLLFVHGAWHGAWCWERFQSFFAKNGYVSVAMSLRGHGKSEGRHGLRWFSAAEYLADVYERCQSITAVTSPHRAFIGRLSGPEIYRVPFSSRCSFIGKFTGSRNMGYVLADVQASSLAIHQNAFVHESVCLYRNAKVGSRGFFLF